MNALRDPDATVAVLLVVFVSLTLYRSGVFGRLGQAIDGTMTVGGR